MRRFMIGKAFLLFLSPLFAAAGAWAVSPDPKLLSLVPPEARIVAGMQAPAGGEEPASFLLITRNNNVDLEGFFALSGADSTRVMHQVIFLAAADAGGTLTEHSLLVSGHFDQARIFRSAMDGGAFSAKYRGIRVLEVQPFARERGTFSDTRWLAMINSEVAIFGTVAIVKRELDRYLDKSTADASLTRKLADLRRDDETWCVLTEVPKNGEISDALDALDPTLGEEIRGGGSFEFGIHYGRHVEFEYEITPVSHAASEATSNTLARSLAGAEPNDSTFLPRLAMDSNRGPARGVVKVSKGRYDAWLAEVSARHARIGALSR
jgi:hypothetical protein